MRRSADRRLRPHARPVRPSRRAFARRQRRQRRYAAAYWALLGPEITLVSTDYDVEAAVAAIRAIGYDNAEAAVEALLEPHTAEEATSVFEARRGA